MDPETSDLLTVDQAIAVIDALPVMLRSRICDLDMAHGLRLTQDLLADRDSPFFDKSLMDGYAVRSGDVESVPATLQVVGETPAGQAAGAGIGPMQAMSIMTGAPIPAGADCVVPIEHTDSPKGFAAAGQMIRVLQSSRPGRNISTRGSDCRAGQVLLPAGTKLGPAQIAVAASVGAAKVSVYGRPRFAVVTTGNEIIDVAKTPGPAQIRNANSPMLRAMLGGFFPDIVLPDNREKIAKCVSSFLGSDHEVMFITGGMSMGKYDYVPGVLTELGGELKITKLAIRPGKPFVLAAMPGGKYVFGLPGNPVSAFVCTFVLASRLLRRMRGESPEMPILQLPLAGRVEANGSRQFYQPGVAEDQKVRPLAWKGSADIFTLARADCLIVRPAHAPPLEAGAAVPVMMLHCD